RRGRATLMSSIQVAVAQDTRTSMIAPAITVHDLTTGYRKQPVLRDINLAVEPGSLVGVIGPNGGGKSTLFKTILGLHKPWTGSILIHGEAGKPGRKIGCVPQTETVDWTFPVTVGDVVMMGRYPRLGFLRRPGRRDREA